MSKGLQIALGALLVCALLGWAARDALREDGALASFVYYQTLDEFVASKPAGRARVHGYVSLESIERDVPGKQVRFAMQQIPPHAARAAGAYAAGSYPAGTDAGAGNTGAAYGAAGAAASATATADTAPRLHVIYTSLETPDLFRDGAEVVVEGKLAPSGAHFVATNVLAKCPSKFEAAAPTTTADARSSARGATSATR